MKTGSFFIARTVTAALLVLIPAVAAAQVLMITPEAITSSVPLEKARQENKGRATIKLEGKGGILRLTYKALQPLTIFMVPLSPDGTFVQTDFILLTLPISDQGAADIDLTISRGWSPRNTTWLLSVITKDTEAIAEFSAAEFLPISTVKTVTTFFRHSLNAEPYTPSSYHGLRGYHALKLDLTIIMGLALVLACAAAFVFRTKEKKLQTLIIIFILFHALYGLRFSIDVLRFTGEHLLGYSRGHYDEAGSIYDAAMKIAELAAKTEKEMNVFVCRSGTDYKEKILRYMTYPVTVSSEVASAANADVALGMDTSAWTLESTKDGELLHCKDLSLKVRTLAQFPDGSVLFTLHR